MTLEKKPHFEKTVLLTLGRSLGILFSIGIPVFLSRWLSISEYGTFRQLMLVHWFLMSITHMGLDFGLFYFIKQQQHKFPIFSLNVMLAEVFLGLAFISPFVLFPHNMASLFNNPSLAEYLPLFSLFLLLAIPAQHFEHYMVVLEKIKISMLLEASYEILKAAVVIGGFYFFNSLKVVILGYATISLIKLFCLFYFNLRELKKLSLRLTELPGNLLKQIKYSLPLGFTYLISFSLKLDRFIVSALFTVEQFTVYSVGCFNIPLIPTIVNTMLELMSIDMIQHEKKADFGKLQELWRTTMRKIFLVQIPVGVFLIFFAEEVITLVFSEQYRGSAIYFRFFVLIFLLPTENSDLVFRVFAKTKDILKIQSVTGFYTILAIIGGALYFGPLGALLGKLASDCLSLFIKLSFVKKMLHTPFKGLFMWGQLFSIVGISMALGFLTYQIGQYLVLGNLLKIPLLMCFYTLMVFGACLLFKVIKDDERQYLVGKLNQVIHRG